MLIQPQTFAHPAGNGHFEIVDIWDWAGLFVFGALYLGYKRAWGAAAFYLVIVPILYGIIISAAFFVVGITAYHAGSGAGFAAMGGTAAACLAANIFVTHALFGEIGKAYLRRGWRLLSANIDDPAPAENP